MYFNAPSAQKGGPEFRVRASQLSNGQQLILAVPLTETSSTLHRLLLIELAVTGGALILAGLIGAWLVQSGCVRYAISSAPQGPSPRVNWTSGCPAPIARPRWAASPRP